MEEKVYSTISPRQLTAGQRSPRTPREKMVLVFLCALASLRALRETDMQLVTNNGMSNPITSIFTGNF